MCCTYIGKKNEERVSLSRRLLHGVCFLKSRLRTRTADFFEMPSSSPFFAPACAARGSVLSALKRGRIATAFFFLTVDVITDSNLFELGTPCNLYRVIAWDGHINECFPLVWRENEQGDKRHNWDSQSSLTGGRGIRQPVISLGGVFA